MVHHQVLDHIAESDDTGRRAADADNGLDDLIVVSVLVVEVVLFVDQLFEYIGELVGQGLADFGAGILKGYPATHLDQPVEGDFIPVFQTVLFFHTQRQLLLRIIDEGG